MNTNKKWKLYELYFIEALYEKSVKIKKKMKNYIVK